MCKKNIRKMLKKLIKYKMAWKQLKETIIELRDCGGQSNQQELCKFLIKYIEVLEKDIDI